MVSSTATTAVTARAAPPKPRASRSASGAALAPAAGPSTSDAGRGDGQVEHADDDHRDRGGAGHVAARVAVVAGQRGHRLPAGEAPDQQRRGRADGGPAVRRERAQVGQVARAAARPPRRSRSSATSTPARTSWTRPETRRPKQLVTATTRAISAAAVTQRRALAAAERVGDVRAGEHRRRRRADRHGEVEAPADGGGRAWRRRRAGRTSRRRRRRGGGRRARRRSRRAGADSRTRASQASSEAGPATAAARAGSEITPVPSTAPIDRAVPCATVNLPCHVITVGARLALRLGQLAVIWRGQFIGRRSAARSASAASAAARLHLRPPAAGRRGTGPARPARRPAARGSPPRPTVSSP